MKTTATLERQTVTVPRLWPGSTIVCLGGGPSLTPEDVAYVREKDVRVVAVNDAYRLAPWADVVYASDGAWWHAHRAVLALPALKYSIEWSGNECLPPGVLKLRASGHGGIETDPSAIRTGHNSGAAAINLAVHLGATRILLLGYDLSKTGGRSHWFGDHPPSLRRESPYGRFAEMFHQQLPQLSELGVDVVNCSRHTALTCIPRMPLEEAL